VTVAPGSLVAVTGGTGGIGRIVVGELLDAGFRVRLLSRSAPQDQEVEHAAFDLTADDPVEAGALAGCSAVVHLAAHIPRDQEDPATAELCFRTNALGTLNLLEAVEGAGVDRFLQTTSANAYAPGLDSPSEEDPMYPAGRAPFYLSSKVAQDVFGSYWGLRRGMKVTTLRLSSVYGEGIEGALFTRFARTLIGGDAIRLANGGTFGADFVEASDISRALLLFLRKGATGAFNIASGERTTLLEASRLLLDLAGCGEDRLIVEPTDQPEKGFPRIDVSKVQDLGFVPTDLRTGLARLVDWVKAGADGEPA
jgi:UDP-glucose 4-epimerase